ncbi:MAG TPA: ANTAR domain-containing protein [Sulfuriferula sp.]|nr:ANTAR domain-containing protein [Sulfuriferula sp.]
MLTVLIADHDITRAARLEQAFRDQGYAVADVVNSAFELTAAVAKHAPDIIIMGTDSPDRDTLEHLCIATRNCPRPVVMFTQDDASESIRAALKAGVSAYVVDGLDAERIRPILEVARIRFEEHQILLQTAAETARRTHERSVIDAAKRKLMAHQDLSEDAAYHAMRRAAMSENRRLVEIAESILQQLGQHG